MGKYVNDLVLDQALNYISNNCDQMVICTDEPTSYSDAVTDAPTGKSLGKQAMTGSDFTLTDGDASGRKLRVAQQTGITLDVSGNASHVALVDTNNSRMLLVSQMSNTIAVVAGNTASVNAFDQEIGDPT